MTWFLAEIMFPTDRDKEVAQAMAGWMIILGWVVCVLGGLTAVALFILGILNYGH